MTAKPLKVTRALISVSDKTHLDRLGPALAAQGIEILSTGGTARTLRDLGVPVVDVAERTGFPEIMGGRVKTLHPKVHGGILGRRGTDDAVMAEHDIQPIDLVVINLYPFEATVARPGCSRDEAVEQIDIGGPAMLRAAAKNHRDVAIVVDPTDYDAIVAAIEADGIDAAARATLAAKAFGHTANYDAAIAAYLTADEAAFPAAHAPRFERVDTLRYGENPHQQAAVYAAAGADQATVAATRPLQGKALSYNNLADTDAALACVAEFDLPACVIVKHANPCGVAEGRDLATAYDAAFAADATSAFGGIIAFNRPLAADLAKAIIDRQFVEVIAAPSVAPDALEVLAAKPNVRVIAASHPGTPARQLKTIGGGLLIQDEDRAPIELGDLKIVSERQPAEGELEDLLFAWRVVKHVRSNAIVLAGGNRTLGVGAGQMSRVMSVRIAGWKLAELDDKPARIALASDAFFPFRDGIDAAAELGVTSVIQPGGSMRDAEVIAAADEHDMLMVVTGRRHFRH
ncbi:MAG: bifunctional phosphoribosylaminoimidazolecarboxamide formyltransferase/IMP cyclohydrolase [Pseudomonadota bacterium]